jgi:hypothetical protein
MSQISGLENVGRCVDLVELDPLDIVSSCKVIQAVLPLGGDDVYPIGDDLKVPKGVEVMSPYKLTVSGGETLMSNSYDFTRSFENSISVDGSFGGFGFTASRTAKQVQKDSQSRSETFTYVYVTSAIHILKLSLSGVSSKYLFINQDLRNSVASLPDSGDEAAYAAFIQEYGTHFLSQVALGGMAWSRVSSAKVGQSSSKEDESEFKASATAEIDKFKSGVSKTEARKALEESDKQHGITRSQITCVGGTGDTSSIASTWVESLDKKSVPIHEKLHLTRLSTLLTTKHFPDDTAIEVKRKHLEAATSRYIKQKGGDEGEQIRYGHPVQLRSLDGRRALHCSNPVAMGPSPLFAQDPARPSSGGLANFEVIGPRRVDGEAVMAGDPVTFKFSGSNAHLVIGYTPLVTNTGETGFAALLQAGPEARTEGEYSLRIMGSRQQFEGSPEKRRPLVSGDVVMISRYDNKMGRFVFLYSDPKTDEHLVRTQRNMTDWLFTLSDPHFFFIVSNA